MTTTLREQLLALIDEDIFRTHAGHLHVRIFGRAYPFEEWEATLRAIRNVVEEHKPLGEPEPGLATLCNVCADEYSARTVWPCPTLLRLSAPWRERLKGMEG